MCLFFAFTFLVFLTLLEAHLNFLFYFYKFKTTDMGISMLYYVTVMLFLYVMYI